MAIKTFAVPLGSRRRDPFVFKTFFELGLEESASPFLGSFSRKIAKNIDLKASFFAAFLLLLAFVLRSTPLHDIFLVGVYVVAGVPLITNSIHDVIRKKEINIDLLMTLAAFSAYFIDSAFEGALLMVLFAVSEALEIAVTLKAKKALSTVHELQPTKAYVIDADYHVKELAVQDVPIGTLLLVRAGETVPLDGIVVEGESELSLQHITGEARPIYKRIGDELFAGARVLEGALTMKVTRTSSDSTCARIIELITKAEKSKPRLESFFDAFGRYYATSIIVISLVSLFVFHYWLLLPWTGSEGAFYRSLSFLITASPCALILAVPIAYISALGACARRGAVLKGGVILDALHGVKAVAFDKTGTLTLGELSLQTIQVLSGRDVYTDQELLSIAQALERNAVHPISKALTSIKGLESLSVADIEVVPGRGVHGTVRFRDKRLKAFIGKPKEKVAGEHIVAFLELPDAEVLFFFEDTIRPKSKEAIDALHKRGKKVFILTGDTKESAERVAKELGIEECLSGLKPEDKLNTIDSLSAQFGLVMCGDGINDAPALTRATVGISMGKIGSGTAKEASSCVLLDDNIELIPWLFDKSESTRRVVRQNVIIALSAICLASIPALYGVVPLWLAVVLHEGGTVLVGLNAVRLLK